mmetsp:Transcript_6256/g.18359  ORF Transcript_6256/g.18359 Transcript_6256/m.18359 type:complete len:306 (-) Transcript_6256:5640-6557(-)
MRRVGLVGRTTGLRRPLLPLLLLLLVFFLHLHRGGGGTGLPSPDYGLRHRLREIVARPRTCSPGDVRQVQEHCERLPGVFEGAVLRLSRRRSRRRGAGSGRTPWRVGRHLSKVGSPETLTSIHPEEAHLIPQGLRGRERSPWTVPSRHTPLLLRLPAVQPGPHRREARTVVRAPVQISRRRAVFDPTTRVVDPGGIEGYPRQVRSVVRRRGTSRRVEASGGVHTRVGTDTLRTVLGARIRGGQVVQGFSCREEGGDFVVAVVVGTGGRNGRARLFRVHDGEGVRFASGQGRAAAVLVVERDAVNL